LSKLKRIDRGEIETARLREEKKLSDQADAAAEALILARIEAIEANGTPIANIANSTLDVAGVFEILKKSDLVQRVVRTAHGGAKNNIIRLEVTSEIAKETMRVGIREEVRRIRDQYMDLMKENSWKRKCVTALVDIEMWVEAIRARFSHRLRADGYGVNPNGGNGPGQANIDVWKSTPGYVQTTGKVKAALKKAWRWVVGEDIAVKLTNRGATSDDGDCTMDLKLNILKVVAEKKPSCWKRIAKIGLFATGVGIAALVANPVGAFFGAAYFIGWAVGSTVYTRRTGKTGLEWLPES